MITAILFSTLTFANSSPQTEVDIRDLSSRPEEYLGKSVSTKGTISYSEINHQFERIQIYFQGSGAPAVVLIKDDPLYVPLARDLPSHDDRIAVQGTLHKFSNTNEFYISPTNIERRKFYTFIVTKWWLYGSVIFFVVLGVLGSLAESLKKTSSESSSSEDKISST